MGQHLERELKGLKRKLLSLSAIVEDSVARAIHSVEKRDQGAAKRVIERDPEIDEMEVEIEEDCLKILALHQPVAIDLRFIVATLKINNDLERIADLAVNIAERAVYISRKSKSIEAPFDFQTMSQKTLKMLDQSIESLIQMNSKLAHRVCLDDEAVDEINRQMYETVTETIKKSPSQSRVMINYLSVSRHLERIADYATNIAEDIIYMIEGTIVRHKTEEFFNEDGAFSGPSAQFSPEATM